MVTLNCNPLPPYTLSLPHTLPRAAAINLCRQPFQLVPSIYFLLLLFGEFSVFFLCVFCFLFLQLVNISLLCWRHTRQRRWQRRRSAAAAAAGSGGDIIRGSYCCSYAALHFSCFLQLLQLATMFAKQQQQQQKQQSNAATNGANVACTHTHTNTHTHSRASNKVVETKLTAFAFVPLAMHYPIIICMHAL